MNANWKEFEQSFSVALADKTKAWMQYKKEKRQGYKEQGLKQLLGRIIKKAGEYGDNAVISVIDDSKANKYHIGKLKTVHVLYIDDILKTTDKERPTDADLRTAYEIIN